jgi:hypothetical protein
MVSPAIVAAGHVAPNAASESVTQRSYNDGNSTNKLSVPSNITLQETLSDLGSWWCHLILFPSSPSSCLNGDHFIDLRASARHMKELEKLLQVLDPVEAASPICARLRCLVIWKEFIRQLLVVDEDGNTDCDENGDSDYINDIGRRDFATLLHQLQSARQTFFAHSTAPANYDEVLKLVEVHGKLACLYRAFAPENTQEMSHQELCNILDDCSDDWDSIFSRSRPDQNDGNHTDDVAAPVVPTILAQIVDTEQPGLTPLVIQKRIKDVLSASTSNGDSFSCAHLQRSLQRLLLYWCEIEDGGDRLPELVRLGFRGVGVVNRSIVVEMRAGEGPASVCGVVDVGVTEDVNSTTAEEDRGAASNRSGNRNTVKNGRNNVRDTNAHAIQQRRIVQKRKIRPFATSPANEDESTNDEEASVERHREEELDAMWPDDSTSASSTSGSSALKWRTDWSAELSDDPDEGQLMVQNKRNLQRSQARAELQRLARSGRPAVSTQSKDSGSPSSGSSGNNGSFLSPTMTAMNSRLRTKRQRHRSGPLPLSRGDFMTPPEEYEKNSKNSKGCNRRARSVDGTRKKIRWEEGEDKGKELGVVFERPRL